MAIFKTFLFLVFIAGPLLFWAPFKLSPSNPDGRIWIDSFRMAAFLPWLAGTLIFLWSCREFVCKGQGTPMPVDPPKVLVSEGLYRFVRNPMYLAALLILLGHVLWFQTLQMLIGFVALSIGFHLFVLFWEEPHLKRRFKDSFDDYCRKTPRWVPRFREVKRSGDKRSAPR